MDDCGLKPEDIDGVFSSPGPLGGPWGGDIPATFVDHFQDTPGDPEDGIAKATAGWLARNMGLPNATIIEDRDVIIGTVLNDAIDAVGHPVV